MINAAPRPGARRPADGEDAAVEAIVQAGAGGAVMLAGMATAVVIGLWLAFYFVVFLPRAIAS
jgi:hypothetical protein